ncbi:hypothetical protein LJB96_03690 [Methanobrevibacter sp. OttesenSCG-928-K11]|nr:hypothetical protein [Methanobrevibacter sp. OttesenSCG-928-K11]
MEIIEALAIIILILAILVLVYYYLENNPATANKIRSYVPQASAHETEQMPGTLKYVDDTELDNDFDDDESMSRKIKVKLSDIDMSSFNTDAFSKKFDSFLDEKSDELIKDWDLATKKDLGLLEERFNSTSKSVDELENRFNKFKNESDEKFDDLENRIKALEEK